MKRNKIANKRKRENKKWCLFAAWSLFLQFRMRVTILLFQLFLRWKLNNSDWLGWIIKTILQHERIRRIPNTLVGILHLNCFLVCWKHLETLVQIKSNPIHFASRTHSSTKTETSTINRLTETKNAFHFMHVTISKSNSTSVPLIFFIYQSTWFIHEAQFLCWFFFLQQKFRSQFSIQQSSCHRQKYNVSRDKRCKM